MSRVRVSPGTCDLSTCSEACREHNCIADEDTQPHEMPEHTATTCVRNPDCGSSKGKAVCGRNFQPGDFCFR
jgi:hypothetical protein